MYLCVILLSTDHCGCEQMVMLIEDYNHASIQCLPNVARTRTKSQKGWIKTTNPIHAYTGHSCLKPNLSPIDDLFRLKADIDSSTCRVVQDHPFGFIEPIF